MMRALIRKYWRNLGPRRGALSGALVVFALSLLVWWRASQWYESQLWMEQRAAAAVEVSTRSNALSSAVNRRLDRLQELGAWVQSEAMVPDFEPNFEVYAAGLYNGSTGIRNVAVAPAGVVQYVYPLAGNESVIGYEPLQDARAEVRADVERAIRSHEIVLTGPTDLVQGGLGLIARQAVYHKDGFWGLVNVVLDVPQLLTEVGVDDSSGTFHFALRDGRGRVFFGSPELFVQEPVVVPVTLITDDSWELAVAPRVGWAATVQEPLLVFESAGLIIIALSMGLIYLTINRQANLSLAVQQRTQQLSVIKEELEQRVQERTRELSTLLGVSRNLTSILELTPLLGLILDQLRGVLDYSGASILVLEDDSFCLRAYRGPVPQETALRLWLPATDTFGQQIMNSRQVIIIPDVHQDTSQTRTIGEVTQKAFNTTHRYVRSWMGVPLTAKEQVIGVLSVHHSQPDYFADKHAELALAFASQVAVAIENARLYEQARTLAALQERQKLARELHDSVSQALYGIALGARSARTLLDRAAIDKHEASTLATPLDYVLSLAEAGLTEMRALIFELRPESLATEGLVMALTRQADTLRVRHSIEVQTFLADEPDTPLEVKEALWRVSQEALHNVVKHAGASHVTLQLATSDRNILLQISDNGRGFDSQGSFPGHLGLNSMRERVEAVRGDFQIESSPTLGTSIRIRVSTDGKTNGRVI